MSAAKAVVTRFVESFGRGDLATVLALLDPDVVVDEAGGLEFSGVHRGPDGFRAMLATLGSRLDAGLDTARVLSAEDGSVITLLDLTFRSRATGRRLPTRVTERYTVRDGLITHLDSFYKDPAAVAELYAER